MTPTRWQLALVVGVVVAFVVRRAADLLNLRAQRDDLPPDAGELAALYDAERRRAARRYTAARTRFDVAVAAIDLGVLLTVWLGGGFGWLDRVVHRLDRGPVVTGLAFLVPLGLAEGVLSLPARWWATFVLEARFGFNRATARTFWTDAATGLAVAVVVGGPLVAAVLWLFARLGPSAWWWCWAAGTAWLLAVQYVAPTWLLPLFNRFTPLPDGPLRTAILAYVERVGFPVADVWVVDGSRRSTKANAFFTGFGARKRIALFDTLVDRLDADEVLAVVAHEVGHYKRRHVPLGIALGIAHVGVTCVVLSWILATPAFVAAFGFATPSVHAALVAFAVASAAIELPLGVALNALSRRHERAADRFAAETTGAPRRLATALARLATDALSDPTPHPLYVALHYSHPPVVERLRALHAAGATSG